MIELSKALGIFRKQVSAVKKDADNPFFKSKYADLPSILEVIKDPLEESGLCLYHTMKGTENGYVVITTITHQESGEKIESEFPVFGNKPQEIGSSISYARRYNIQAMLDIPTEDDDGNQANTASRTKTVSQEPQKPWMKEPEFEKMKENISMFETADEAVRVARVKYAVSKPMEQTIRSLF